MGEAMGDQAKDGLCYLRGRIGSVPGGRRFRKPKIKKRDLPGSSPDAGMWNAIQYITGGLTLVAFLAAVASLVYRRYLLHQENIVKSAPDSDRAKIILAKYSGISVDVSKLTRDQKFQIATTQIGNKANQFKIGAMLVGLIAVLLAILAAVAIVQSGNEHTGKLEGENKQAKEQISDLEKTKADLIQIINGGLAKVDQASTELLKVVKKTEAKPPKDDAVPVELVNAKKKLEQELSVAMAKIAEYEKRFGRLPATDTQALGQAEKSIQAAKKYFPSLTLENAFIERVKDRVTLDTALAVDQVGKIHSPNQDGDLHIAGRSADIGFVTVAEIMNAANEKEAVSIARKGVGQTIAVKGVWRFWFEQNGAGEHVQKASLPIPETSNPLHLFEIHPVIEIGGVSILRSLTPISGYQPKQAERAFNTYERIPCKVERLPNKTKITSTMAGYNYVEFILEAKETPKEVEDGWLVNATVRGLGEEVLSRSVRMVVVKGSPPATKLAKLTTGDRARVLGMPRINLSLVHARVAEAAADPQILDWPLPYEMVIVGIYD